jgi:hypothetical protein
MQAQGQRLFILPVDMKNIHGTQACKSELQSVFAQKMNNNCRPLTNESRYGG